MKEPISDDRWAKAKANCQKSAVVGCASGIDRIYCVGLKPWSWGIPDILGAKDWGFDFANAK